MNIPNKNEQFNPIALTEVNGENRMLDLNIAEALGFERPRNIRKLIERHKPALEAFGEVCSTVEQTTTSGGRPAKAYYLNEEQAIYACTKSDTENATQVTIEVVKTFVAVKNGKLTPEPVTSLAHAREVRLQTRELSKLAKLMGFEGNQLVLSVCQGVERITGTNPMGAMGVTHLEAPENTELLNAGDIGLEFDCSPQAMNMRLVSGGYQTASRTKKGKLYYEATQKGLESGAVMTDTSKNHSNGTPVRQLKWSSRIVDVLKTSEGGAA